eukprot:scaffold242289_cov31-Tisochrysis_lutea.AAC.4
MSRWFCQQTLTRQAHRSVRRRAPTQRRCGPRFPRRPALPLPAQRAEAHPPWCPPGGSGFLP